MTSAATVRPRPSQVWSSCCVTTAWSVVASCTRICCCWYEGNASMIRSIVCGASWVCSVANTRCPVSAAVMAVWMVSKSRISPTRITSGSCRSTCFRALAKEWVSAPISRWLTMARLCRCRYSMGSSTVMMWQGRSVFTMSIRAASVVDLPEPVGPVTSTSPRARSANSATCPGRPSSSSERILNGISRKAAPMASRWKYTLTRNRPLPGRE